MANEEAQPGKEDKVEKDPAETKADDKKEGEGNEAEMVDVDKKEELPKD